MALCSLSTGRRSTPAACAAAITSSPAATRTSLLERAICLPCWIAAYVASRPTTPTAAETRSSTSGCVPTASKPSRPHWMSGKGARPWARSRPASSSARAAFATETSCGRWRAICEAIRSMFSPAARASTQKRDGSDSTTLRHCRPIDPVDPRMARRFKACLFSIPCLPHGSTRPGMNGAGFPAGVERGRIVVRTLLDFLGLCTRGFVGAEVRRHFPPANGPPDEIGCRIACPNQDQREKQEFRSDTRHSLKRNAEAQGQSDEEQAGGADAQRGQGFGEGPASREHDYGCTDNEHEKKKRKQGQACGQRITIQKEAAGEP